MLKKYYTHIIFFLVSSALFSCKARNDHPGYEFAPNMYHSVPYLPLSQITNSSEGSIISNREDRKGEYYNSNINNFNRMNMRVPPANTVKRTKNNVLYQEPKSNDIEFAAKNLKNPLTINKKIMEEGKQLYETYCAACHGKTGLGDGKVAEVFLGIPAYNVGVAKTLTEGHIFHVITHGIRRMGAHGSQIEAEDRWKIVNYVQKLQQQ